MALQPSPLSIKPSLRPAVNNLPKNIMRASAKLSWRTAATKFPWPSRHLQNAQSSDPVKARIVICASYTVGGNGSKHSADPINIMAKVQLEKVDSMLNAIKWDKNGLVVAIAQHLNTGAILMQGFANCDAVSATIASGRATFYSRSRSSLWTKGETSSNFINVKDVFLDCDRDSIIYLGLPDGPTCHTGAKTCYFTPASSFDNEDQNSSTRLALTTLYSLEDTISKRRDSLLGQSVSGSSGKPSWTQKLLKDHSLLCSKIREEADELCRTLENSEGKECAASEMADVLYHSMVLLAVQDVRLEDVIEILRVRFAKSGIEEKNSRTRSTC